MDGDAFIAYVQMCRRNVGQIVLRFDEGNRPVQFPGLQRIIAQRLPLPEFAFVVVARPALLIVCRKSRTPPIAVMHRELAHCPGAWWHSGHYWPCWLRIGQV